MFKFLRIFRSRRFWIAVGIVLVFFVAMTVVSVEMTSKSDFCNNCHIMESYYDSWHASSHRHVECVECHIPPGTTNYVWAKLNGLGQVVDDWLNRTSTKPSASVSDFACMRDGCHDLAEIEKKLAPTDERPFMFDHSKHLDLHFRGIAVHCSTCHSHVEGNSHFKVNTNACVTCHLIAENGDRRRTTEVDLANMVPAISTAALVQSSDSNENTASGHSTSSDTSPMAPANCDACHEPPSEPFEYRGLTVDHSEYLHYGASCQSCHHGATAPAQEVSDSQCYACHDFGMERALETNEMHRVHTEGEHKVECFSCHGVTKHGPSAQAMALNRFNCQECHIGQHLVQRSTYQTTRPPNGHPQEQAALSPMFMAHVDCTGCHTQPDELSVKPDSGAKVAKAVASACDDCHQDGLGEKMIPLWQSSTKKMYEETMALLPDKNSVDQQEHPEAATLLEQARQLLNVVRVDGSWGVHNPRYTQRLLEQAREKILEARDLLDADRESSS